MIRVICPHCGLDAKLVTGQVIYPHRPDLHDLRFWSCKPCDAYVGCHKQGARLTDREGQMVVSDGTYPLGGLANALLRHWKGAVHARFDPIWRSGRVTRGEAYGLLAAELGMPTTHCHIGYFDVATCQRALEVLPWVRHAVLTRKAASGRGARRREPAKV